MQNFGQFWRIYALGVLLQVVSQNWQISGMRRDMYRRDKSIWKIKEHQYQEAEDEVCLGGDEPIGVCGIERRGFQHNLSSFVFQLHLLFSLSQAALAICSRSPNHPFSPNLDQQEFCFPLLLKMSHLSIEKKRYSCRITLWKVYIKMKMICKLSKLSKVLG